MTRKLAILIVALLGLLVVAWLRWAGPPGHANQARAADLASTEDEQTSLDHVPSLPAPGPDPSSSAPPVRHVVDRARADRMRQALTALFAEAGLPWGAPEPPGAASAPSAYPTMPVLAGSGPDAAPRIDPKYIQERVRGDLFPLAMQCYQSGMAKDPKLAGRIELKFTIMGDPKVGGVVGEASLGDGTTIADPEFQTCVKESLMSVSFDAPPNGGEVTVVYPIDFSPDEPEPPPAGSARR